MHLSIADEIFQQLKGMPQPLQQQVLEFVRTLIKADGRGTPGPQLLRFAGSIPADDLKAMREAIERDCERVDVSEW